MRVIYSRKRRMASQNSTEQAYPSLINNFSLTLALAV